MVTKRMADLTRINDLEKQLHEAQARLRAKEIDDLAKQAEKDVLQMLCFYKR